MKQILKEYINTLREIKRLEEKKEELLKQLLHAKTPDGEELGDVIFEDKCRGSDLITENFPDDTTDGEYVQPIFISWELYYLKEREEIEAGKIQIRGLGQSRAETEEWGHNEGW